MAIDEYRYHVIRDFGFTHEQALFLAGGDPAHVYGSDSGGSSAVGAPVVRAFPFAFDTAGLVAGHTVWTPEVGDVLIDAWFTVSESWDATAHADIGQFLGGGTAGWFSFWSGAVSLTNSPYPARMNVLDDWYAQNNGGVPPGSLSGSILQLSGTSSLGRQLPTDPFQAAHPIKLCVSDTGATDGADPGATQGAGILYLVTATPAT